MFENILGQAEARDSLIRDLSGGTLPGSMLFEGPALSAKLSAALELTRGLSCERDAAWNCPCPQCARHRSLVHQDLLLLGPKSFREELAIGRAMMERAPGAASRYFFTRAARKLTRRFDRELYEGEEGRLAKALPLVRSALEGIDACSPLEAGGLPDETVAKEADRLVTALAKLEDLLPASVPVFQVRAAGFWSRLAPYGRRKVVVIEHADMMLDSSRNALLKVLEEPPEHASFILTTSRRQAIIPTVLSRVRRYRFVQRSEKESRQVIERIFKDSSAAGGRSVAAYVAGFRSASAAALDALARDFAAALAASVDRRRGARAAGLSDPALAALARSGGELASAVAAAAAATSGFGSGDESAAWTFPAFLDKAGSVFSSLLREEGSGLETQRMAEAYASLARDALIRHDSYNLQATALCERLACALVDAFAGPPSPRPRSRAAASSQDGWQAGGERA